MKSIVPCLALLAFAPLAQAANFVISDSTHESKICLAAASGTPIQFDRAIRHSPMNFRTVAKHLQCNQTPVADFAKQFSQYPDVVVRLEPYQTGASAAASDASEILITASLR